MNACFFLEHFFDVLQVTALYEIQKKAFRVTLEGDAVVAMECDNLLGTCFLLRLRQQKFEYVKFSSLTGEVLRVLNAPELRFAIFFHLVAIFCAKNNAVRRFLTQVSTGKAKFLLHTSLPLV